MNNRDQFSSFSGMSPHDRIEDMKRRLYENRHDPRMFGMPNYTGSPHDRMSPFFERTFGNRSSPQPSSGEARSVPINVQHQQQQQHQPNSASSHPGMSSQPPQNPPQNPADSTQNHQQPNAGHNPQHPYYESNDDFYPPGFMPFSGRDPEFFGFRRPEFMNRMNESPADGKVVHIPIHVESGQQNSANHGQHQHRQSSPQPQPPQPQQQQQQYPNNDRLNSSSSSLPNNSDMTKQQTGNGVRYETQPQPRQQQPSVYNKSPPIHNQYQQGSASQGDIPIQVLREQSPKDGRRESRKPQQNSHNPPPQQPASQPEEKDVGPIPMPYSPLNSTKDTNDSSGSDSGDNNNSNNKNPKQDSKCKDACTMKSTPRDCIDSILADLQNYEREANDFVGTANDKAYKYLDEMLTRCILKLDDIDTAGNDELRKHRKSAVNEAERIARLLESRVANSRNTSTNSASTSDNSGSQTQSSGGQESQEGEKKEEKEEKKEGGDKAQEGGGGGSEGAQESDAKSGEQKDDKKSDKEKDKKEKPKKKFFFIKKKEPVTVTDTNNNAVTGKETAV